MGVVWQDCSDTDMCAGGDGMQVCSTCKKIQCNKIKKAPETKVDDDEGGTIKENYDEDFTCQMESGEMDSDQKVCSCNGD